MRWSSAAARMAFPDGSTYLKPEPFFTRRMPGPRSLVYRRPAALAESTGSRAGWKRSVLAMDRVSGRVW